MARTEREAIPLCALAQRALTGEGSGHSLPPSWAGLQGLRAQQDGAGGASGEHRDPLGAHISLFLQDYMDALMTNYCVSAGKCVTLSLLRGAAVGSVGHSECQAGGRCGVGTLAGSSLLLTFSAQIWPPVQIANFYFVPLQHR